ncbi:MAG: HTH domain-containing protein, partial [Actinobacteria bacterium]|nr:HTH domain-containing protein [Actinomycetota bacterium]
MKISNIWRLLRILLIFSRKPAKIKAKEIAQDIEISVRQVYRDIDCL